MESFALSSNIAYYGIYVSNFTYVNIYETCKIFSKLRNVWLRDVDTESNQVFFKN